MVSFNQSATFNCPLTPDELALAKEVRDRNKWSSLLFQKLKSECDEERAALHEKMLEKRENGFLRPASQAWQTATGLQIFTGEDFEIAMQYLRHGVGFDPFSRIPQVPAFGLPNGGFSFNAATNTINIGIGSRIQMDGFFLEVLANTVVARSHNGSVSEKGMFYANALNSLLRGVGVDASWGYDDSSLQGVLRFLQNIGVDTNRPFFINSTQFEMQNGKLRTVGQTTKQDLQFWGFEGLNRLVQRAYAQNLF